MAGLKNHNSKMLELLSTKVKMDKPTSVDRLFGCHHCELDPITIDGHLVRRLDYDMRDFLDSAVKVYYELAGPNAKALKKVAMPYMPDNELCPNGVGAPQSSKPVDKTTKASTSDQRENVSAAKAGGQKPHETKQMTKSIKSQKLVQRNQA
eukprot:3644309-Amphidinium_carterae.5